MSESVDDVIIGPTLPPGYGRNMSNDDIEQLPIDLSSNRENLPEELDSSYVTEINDSRRNEERDSKIIGPVLPNDWKISSTSSKLLDSHAYGPALPPGFKNDLTKQDFSDEDEDTFGPLPCEAANCNSDYDIVSDVERRAKKMKDHLDGKDNPNVLASAREEWMTQLPEALGHKIGIVPRTFRQNNLRKNEDRSVWTDTPADVEKKSKEKQVKKNTAPDLKEYARQARDQQMFEQMEEYNKSKRTESLLEIHRKNRKRKAKEEAGPTERRPFDRDVDLSASHCKPSQTKSVLDKAKFLNSRFSHGSSHFL